MEAMAFVKTNIPTAPGNIPRVHEQCESLIDQNDDDTLENPFQDFQLKYEYHICLWHKYYNRLPYGYISTTIEQSPLSQSPTRQSQASNMTKKKSGFKHGMSTTDVDVKSMN